MILLDTEYLNRALVPDSIESERILGWFEAGEDLCTSSIAWYEFLCGPFDDVGGLTVSRCCRSESFRAPRIKRPNQPGCSTRLAGNASRNHRKR